MGSRLKRAEKDVEDMENNMMPMSAPSFATPQKRESFRQSGMTPLQGTSILFK